MGAGSSCCGGGEAKHSKETKESTPSGHTELPPVPDEFKEENMKAYPKVEFDLLLPEGTSPADLKLDQSMHTMRDTTAFQSASAGLGGSNNIDLNLSFTNSVKEVNKDVIELFTKNLAKMAQGNALPSNMLEESIIGPVANKDLSESFLSSSSGARFNNEDAMYIEEGKTLEERLSRLAEVEEATREQLVATWKVNHTLILLGSARLVPTLRQRRVWGKSNNSTSATASNQGGRETLVISAPGVLTDENSISSPNAAPPLNAAATNDSCVLTDHEFTPRHGDTSASLRMERSMRSQSLRGVPPPVVEHFEMLALTCRDIPVPCSSCHARVIDGTWDFLSLSDAATSLNGGKCLFRFMCAQTNEVDDETKALINTFINVSSFKDELKENNCPKVDIYDNAEASKYIGILVKAMYMLPGVKLANITPENVASLQYQKGCQPGSTKIEDTDRSDTFRLTMTIIKFVFSLTIQFKVSEVTDPELLASFKSIDGIVPAKVLMLERTKRNVGKVDATAKVRSMLLYYPVNDGVLVNSQTIVLNTSLPKVVSKLVNTFGSSGAQQSADTAKLTRNYLVKTYGDTRKTKK